jgi:Protein of unknown function (DUF1552)
MNRTIFAKSVARRTVLASVGAGVAGLLLRPLQAQEAGVTPKRLLIVHRPCGSVLEKFFPSTGDAKTFTLPSIIKSFEPLKNDMVIVNGINCSRDPNWESDKHAAALITMMSGTKFRFIGASNSSTDPNAKNIISQVATIDQHLLKNVPALQVPGAKLPSIQSTAYGPSSQGLPSFSVMSYSGVQGTLNGAMFPEYDAGAMFKKLFVNENAGLTPAQIALKNDQNKSVLDRVNADLTRLSGLVPASQKPKLDAHLAGIQALEQALQDSGPVAGGKTCTPPDQAPLADPPSGVTADEAHHLAVAKNQLAIIQTAFQCDLTRVATFTFAHGNSGLRFNKIDPTVDKGDGHHGVSHDTSAAAAQERIDTIYCEQLSAFLQKMKAVQEGTGTLLDNTLVVFFNECAVGNTHSIENMPVLMLGGKMLGMQTGQHLQFGGRYMNDIWAAVCGAFGTEAKFGDAAFTKGPVSGLFA